MQVNSYLITFCYICFCFFIYIQNMECGIPEYFERKNVFITGGSGFMGKVLVEKLLRSCPGLEKLYLLLRPKRGKEMQERLMEMSKIPLFEKLHLEHPGAFEAKVIPISGDMMSLGLGLSEEDRKLLQDKIHIVYHVAATVKFDQPLKDAIIMNTRGTREVCNLVLNMRHVELVTHVSTAYCHTKYEVIEEEMYPAYADWKKCIEIAENMERHELQIMMPLIMEGFPNTYTFTKSMSENVVYDLLNGVIPNIILRPSIVISTLNDPMPGWSDNFNGPFGMFVANATGLIRINLLKDDIKPDYVSVDSAIKAFIISTWIKGTNSDVMSRKQTAVYNCSSCDLTNVTTYSIAKMALDMVGDYTFSTCVWYPTLRTTQSTAVYYTNVLFLHLIPAIFLDTLLKLFNRAPIVWTIQKRIYVATMALRYFIFNQWKIRNEKVYGLENELLQKDEKDFAYGIDNLDVEAFLKNAQYGAKKYLLKDNMDNVENDRKRLKIVYVLDLMVTMAWYFGLFYLFIIKWNVLGYGHSKLVNYIDSL